MDPGRPRLLGQAGHGLLGLLAQGEHEVGELVDQQHHVRHRLPWPLVGGELGPAAAANDLVEGPDVPGAHRPEAPVAVLHLRHQPVEDQGPVGGEVGHHRAGEVGEPLVRGQLDHLGVDHDEPQVPRRVLIDQAGDERVHEDALARSGGAGHEQVRHLGEVGDHRLPERVHAHDDRQGHALGVLVEVLEDGAEANGSSRLVRHLEPHRLLAGDGRQDPQALGREQPGEVVAEADDLRGLGAGGGLELHGGDHRALRDVAHRSLDLELAELLLEIGGELGEVLGLAGHPPADLEHLAVGPGVSRHRGGEVHDARRRGVGRGGRRNQGGFSRGARGGGRGPRRANRGRLGWRGAREGLRPRPGKQSPQAMDAVLEHVGRPGEREVAGEHEHRGRGEAEDDDRSAVPHRPEQGRADHGAGGTAGSVGLRNELGVGKLDGGQGGEHEGQQAEADEPPRSRPAHEAEGHHRPADDQARAPDRAHDADVSQHEVGQPRPERSGEALIGLAVDARAGRVIGQQGEEPEQPRPDKGEAHRFRKGGAIGHHLLGESDKTSGVKHEVSAR